MEGGKHHGNSNTKSNILEIDELVDVSNHPPGKNETDFTLYGFSQFYNYDMEVELCDGSLMGSPY